MLLCVGIFRRVLCSEVGSLTFSKYSYYYDFTQYNCNNKTERKQEKYLNSGPPAFPRLASPFFLLNYFHDFIDLKNPNFLYINWTNLRILMGFPSSYKNILTF